MTKTVLLLNVHRIIPSSMEIAWEIPGGLLSLGSWLETHGYAPEIYSCEPIRAMALIREKAEGSHLLAVGLYCDFENQVEVQELGPWIAGQFAVPVLLGGPQAVGFDARFLKRTGCLAAVVGEGEVPLLRLLQCLPSPAPDWRKIPGLLYLGEDGSLISTGPGEIVEDLDLIPLPAYHLCPDYILQPRYNIMTGRGCPYRCAFCQEGAAKYRARFRSVPSILQEIETVLGRYPVVDYIAFTDDTFTLSLERVREICAGLARLRTRKNFRWYCEAHVERLDRWPEMLDLMVPSGLVRLQIGIESASRKVLDACRKKITPAMVLRVVRNAVKAGVRQIFACILTGAPFESGKITGQNCRFVEKLIRTAPGIIEISPSPVMPYPGTEITRTPEKFGLKVLDPSGGTAISDFPLTESTGLDREAIAQGQKYLVDSMVEVMWKLFREGKVPHERIAYAFRERVERQSFIWRRVVYDRVPFLSPYYSLIARRAVRRSREIPRGELPGWRPQRILELWHDVDFSEGYPAIGRYVLSPLEFDLLLHSTGKLTLQAVLDAVYPKFAGLYRRRREFDRTCMKKMRLFEEKYWLAYAPL